MREFGVRVYHKPTKRMYPSELVQIYADGDMVLLFNGGDGTAYCKASKNRNQVIVMEYSGLKDAGGKRIFEGDIIQKSGHLGVVKFEDGAFVVGKEKTKGY